MDQISRQLQRLFTDIDTLIALTKEDIEFIKNADHDLIKKNNLQKEIIIRRFESNKSLLNHQLLSITNENPDKSLEEILPKDQLDDLEEFKNKLQQLQSVNRDYAKFVSTLNEFFSSLVAAMIPMKTDGYTTTHPQPASFLQVSA